MLPIAALLYLLEYYILLLFKKTQIFLFEFETADQPGFEPRSLWPKAAMLTIEQFAKNVSLVKIIAIFCPKDGDINFFDMFGEVQIIQIPL